MTSEHTDIDRFKALYKDFGIECREYEDRDGNRVIRLVEGPLHDENSTVSDKFDGYIGFYSKIVFSPEGKFIEQGFWE